MSKNLKTILKNGGIAVIPTDTIYGLVCSALSHEAVERVYRIKGRNPLKPTIILISSVSALDNFNIVLKPRQKIWLNKWWPGPASVILACPQKKFHYLHRGKNTLAFRVPANYQLRKLLRTTGPLIAPSANPEGLPPAATIREAKKYFGNKVDLYLAGGRLSNTPSTLVSLIKAKPKVLRQGAVKVS